MLGPIKWVGLGLATLVFMFFMARSLRRREGEALASPSWLSEIEQPVSLAELEAPRPCATPEQPTRRAAAARARTRARRRSSS